ncbi:MAG: hypothetical protein WCI90_00125 [Chlorobium sp.]
MMKKLLLVAGLLVSIIFLDHNTCQAKLFVQLRNHLKYDEAKASFIPSTQGWGQIIRIFKSDTVNKKTSSKNTITREVRLSINEASDLIFLYITPKDANDLAFNKVIKVQKMIISKEIANFNLGVNTEIIVPEQLAKVEEDSKDQVKISFKFSHPDKH